MQYGVLDSPAVLFLRNELLLPTVLLFIIELPLLIDMFAVLESVLRDRRGDSDGFPVRDGVFAKFDVFTKFILSKF